MKFNPPDTWSLRETPETNKYLIAFYIDWGSVIKDNESAIEAEDDLLASGFKNFFRIEHELYFREAIIRDGAFDKLKGKYAMYKGVIR